MFYRRVDMPFCTSPIIVNSYPSILEKHSLPVQPPVSSHPSLVSLGV